MWLSWNISSQYPYLSSFEFLCCCDYGQYKERSHSSTCGHFQVKLQDRLLVICSVVSQRLSKRSIFPIIRGNSILKSCIIGYSVNQPWNNIRTRSHSQVKIITLGHSQQFDDKAHFLGFIAWETLTLFGNKLKKKIWAKTRSCKQYVGLRYFPFVFNIKIHIEFQRGCQI